MLTPHLLASSIASVLMLAAAFAFTLAAPADLTHLNSNLVRGLILVATVLDVAATIRMVKRQREVDAIKAVSSAA